MCRCDAISWSLGKELTTVRWAGGTILISLLPWHTHTCTHTHTHTHVRIHTHLHTLTLTLTHTRAYTHLHSHLHTHTHTHIHTHIHTLTLTYTHSHTHTLTHVPVVEEAHSRHSTHTKHALISKHTQTKLDLILSYQLHYSTVQSVSVCTCMCVWQLDTSVTGFTSITRVCNQ